MINGIFTIAGTVPHGGTMTLLGKDSGGNTPFIPITNNITPKDLSPWEFPTATAGKSYNIKAEMVVNAVVIDSNTITVVAPAVNQVLSFSLQQMPTSSPTSTTNHSNGVVLTPTFIPLITQAPTITPTMSITPTPLITPAASPSAGASISGTLTFTGQPPVSSRVVIFERVTGTTNYQVAIDNFIPYASSVWTWQGVPGTKYDFIAILKQKQSNNTDIDLASSSQITMSTPSTTGALAISYSPVLSAPNPNISVNCNSLDGSSQNWNATINFQTVTGAASYWFQAGTTDGGIDLVNSTKNAISGNNQTLSEPLKNGTTYYAKYAYAGIPNISANNSDFSPLSATAQFKCQ